MNTRSISAPASAPAFYAADNYVAGNDGVGHLLSRLFNTMIQELERQFEPSGLTNAQWKPLFKMSTGEASTVAELARFCTLDAGGMTRMLDRLEAKGLCQRVRSNEDRRVVNLEITEAGRDAAKAIPEVLSRVQNAYLAGFSVEEWEALKSYLRRMLDNANDFQQAQQTTSADGENNAS
ncbi:MAG: MarR family transcriptional regulator [Rhodoferax sp.]|uniref:MarR family winged helix-turn-helix transcriptional regulator n=1 Tax=Rhodoferax sp. TaxID=50421 RepID=UPI003263EC2A